LTIQQQPTIRFEFPWQSLILATLADLRSIVELGPPNREIVAVFEQLSCAALVWPVVVRLDENAESGISFL
jgi:hypothetical protein